MLKTMVDYDVMFYVMSVVALIGVCSKMVSQFALKRLVRAAGNMNKSTHKLMKLMRAKFEHACMVSDRVQNVSAFVEKYVYEYRVLGLRLHTWQQLQRQAMWASVLLGGVGAGMYYTTYGLGEKVYQYGGIGASLMVLLFLLQVTTDERYMLKSAKVYMVDYLENVCVHRYEKMYQRENTGRAAAPSGQAVFAGAGGGNIRSDETASPEKSVSRKEVDPENFEQMKKMSAAQAEKVVSIGQVSAHMAEDASMDRKTRKEMRRENQDVQKKRRFGKKAAVVETVEPEPEPNRSTMEQPAASQESKLSTRELLHAAADIPQPEERAEAVGGGFDSAPKEAMIREILEEFLAQRT